MSLVPCLSDYDRIVVAFSGGKDSAACVLALLEAGADPRRIELHHHDIDGEAPLMDWPVTPAYCRAFADALCIPLYRSGRLGGFLGELDRRGQPSGEIVYERPGGDQGRAGGKGPPGDRGRFPQVSPDLRVRWCSAVLKIDVMDAVIRGQPRFLDGRTLAVTGERAEESSNRALYPVLTSHRTHCRSRQVDHWRPVHDWPEDRVWHLIQCSGLEVHPAYRLGFSRVSCRFCIFLGADALATLRLLYPEAFACVAAREAASGWTIKRAVSLPELADRGAIPGRPGERGPGAARRWPFLAASHAPGGLDAAGRRLWRRWRPDLRGGGGGRSRARPRWAWRTLSCSPTCATH